MKNIICDRILVADQECVEEKLYFIITNKKIFTGRDSRLFCLCKIHWHFFINKMPFIKSQSKMITKEKYINYLTLI